MALFKKEKPKPKHVVLNFDIKSKTPLVSVLKTVMEIGELEDYEYLCEKSAINFYNLNETFLETAINNNGDNFNAFIELLNYFLESFDLGNIQALIDKEEKIIKIYHYNSPFKEFERETFLKEFYRIVFTKLIESEIKIKEEKDDEKVIFTIY